ncbi:hypothetical protein HCN44_002896 [Aphidius gifuensis]|uniref:Phosphatidylinositide phosphatase SAC2 n=1 Tax=Aphidius gifuensis TaxID=684658 RepID=A0A835CP00_APHGI|nr:phosphatidylinositide phosphatase SAC2 [Aphidius gifuensis]KAF7991334.1 hypothetical protein HCN44_002896 [Aphidius gifuensis]
MELFRSDTHFIFVQERHNLWCDRITGELSAKSDWEWASASNLECLGIFYGIIGKIEQSSFMEPRIMLIKEVTNIGELHGNKIIYKIKSVGFLNIGADNNDLNLTPCKKHGDISKLTSTSSSLIGGGGGLFETQQKTGLAKTWGNFKSMTNTIKNTTQHAAAIATSQVKSTVIKRSNNNLKDREKFEKRIIDELTKIFGETDSFFFCQTGDITNSLQRLKNMKINDDSIDDKPIWKIVDDRFFWNKHMLKDIINLNNEAANHWILPIIQGYIQIEKCKVEVGFDGQAIYETFNLAIISRRSRFRAGTRYKRRGVDDDGKCANYVETEQLVWYHDHQVSFVQVRGSVPVYWSQPGYKYKPPPRIDKDEAETQIAFEKHFQEELSCYGPICIINLVEQSGKEKIIWDAYNNHVINYNNPNITYTTFDFHEYCRGMHFENLQILVNALAGVLGEMGYCWYDNQGPICTQKSVFRINCIDCLDRTNVVQTALGKTVMEMQFSKLGLIPPDGTLPTDIRQTFQLLWANNGDIISKQYAGTNALKGDYTRTGERKFSGLMKDGVNSANRYYLNRFKDVYRQASIDLMLGHSINEDIFHEKTEEEDNSATAFHVKLLIEDCKKLLIPDPDVILGSWGLIDADPVTGDPNETEMDTILILTKDSYYVADYDDQIDKVTNYQKVLLHDLVMIEFGQPENNFALFKNKQHHCIRINYKISNEYGYFHMFRSTNLRFFNNMAVVIKNDEETIESMKAICEAFTVAIEISGMTKIPMSINVPLDKRTSKVVKEKGSTGLLDVSSFPQLTRNLSETQLLALKSAGSKALEQFSKLNKLSSTFGGSKKDKCQKPKFTMGNTEISKQQNDEDDEDDNDSIDSSFCPLEYSGEIEKNPDKIIQHVEVAIDGLNFISTTSSSTQGQLERKTTPEITIQDVTFTDVDGDAVDAAAADDDDKKKERIKSPPSTLNLIKNISHSSSEVDGNNSIKVDECGQKKRSCSQHDLIVNNMTTSHSESAIKFNSNSLASPQSVANTTKEILSPFSKFAKGVQTFGANLDPRKLKSGQISVGKPLSDQHINQRQKLIERWTNCKSILIAL